MPLGTPALYDQHASLYDLATHLLDYLLHQQRHNLLGHARGRVLDLAVGTGKNFPYYPPGCQLWGIDLAADMLLQARKRAQRLPCEVTLVRGDAANLPYRNGTFDTVVCTLAGCIFPDPVGVFQELRRVCTSTGTLLFLEHVRPPQPLLSALADVIAPISQRFVGCHPNRPTVQYLEAAGLTIDTQTTSFGGILVSVVARP